MENDQRPRFDIVMADPPWQHESTRGGGSRRAASNHYPTMTTAEIRSLDPFVNAHAKGCARLFLWVPDSMMPDGLSVMAAWGFSFTKIAFVWLKLGKKGLWAFGLDEGTVWGLRHGFRKLAFGAGHTTRNQCEFCILGKRGQMPVGSHSVRQVIAAPTREHSRKPEEAYERIEELYPDATYLELFARHQRHGWASWGNELPQPGETS